MNATRYTPLALNKNNQVLAKIYYHNTGHMFIGQLPDNMPPQFNFVGDKIFLWRQNEEFFKNNPSQAQFHLEDIPIKWEDADPEDNATVSLYYYDEQEMDFEREGILIGTVKEDDDGEGDTFILKRSHLPFNKGLYLYAIIDDGVNKPVRVLSYALEQEIKQGKIEYSQCQYIQEEGEDEGSAVCKETPLESMRPHFEFLKTEGGTIEWRDSDPDSNADISLYYRTVDESSEGQLIGRFKENEDGAGDTFQWDTSALPAGNYYLYAIISDGVHIDKSLLLQITVSKAH